MTIFYSFHGNTQLAHEVVNYQWGLFYPSIYAFSIWQAYNKAIIMNCQQEGANPPRETYLTGFCFGLVIGMNVGVYWHHHFFDNIPFFKILSIPVFNGILLGIIAGFVGHILERYIKRKY
ncbi:hypothetical protein [Virgibacillus ihumii]|uniref:hypothetical protein n=1 Tax=Virgibacillus ihumii TaxID=2686091 RepID=UPI001FE87C01|nr:hypothetical protein [Virgibacillus ihumii]